MEKVNTANKPHAKAAEPAADRNLTVNGCVLCHRGCVRENNEDNFFFNGDLMPENQVDEGALIQARLTKDFHLFAVCDGMGGLRDGELASAFVVNAFSNWFENELPGIVRPDMDASLILNRWNMIVQEQGRKIMNYGKNKGSLEPPRG